MSTLATLGATETGSDSRTDINNNFSALNTDKLETSNLPSSSVDSEVVLFSSTTGKVLKRAASTGWAKLVSGVLSVVTSIVETDFGFTDITTGDVTSTKHGLAPKSPADATKFLNGATAPAYAQVKDSDLATTDITTNDVSSSKHGFAPKGDGTTTKFLNANGAYSTPAAATYKGVVTTHDAGTTGSQTIAHTLGKTPTFVRVTATFASSAAFMTTMSVGTYDGTNVKTVRMGGGNAGPSTSTSNIVDLTGTSSSAANASVTSLDATNLVINWGTAGLTGGGTIQILVEAYG